MQQITGWIRIGPSANMASPSATSPKAGVVYTFGPELVRNAGWVLGCLTDRKSISFAQWAELLDALRASSDPVTICLPYREATASRISQLSAQNAVFGLIPVVSLEDIAETIHALVSDPLAGDGGALGISFNPDSSLRSLGGLDFYHTSQSDDIASALLQPHQVLLLEGHASDDYIGLGKTLICGRQRGWRDAIGRVPCCVKTGHCFSPNATLVGILDLRARIVVVNACNAVRLATSVYGSTFSTALGALKSGTQAYVGTTGIKMMYRFETEMFYRHLRDGRDIGSAAKEVNQAIRQGRLDYGQYVVVGEPTAKATVETSSGTVVERPWAPLELDPQHTVLVTEAGSIINSSEWKLASRLLGSQFGRRKSSVQNALRRVANSTAAMYDSATVQSYKDSLHRLNQEIQAFQDELLTKCCEQMSSGSFTPVFFSGDVLYPAEVGSVAQRCTCGMELRRKVLVHGAGLGQRTLYDCDLCGNVLDTQADDLFGFIELGCRTVSPGDDLEVTIRLENHGLKPIRYVTSAMLTKAGPSGLGHPAAQRGILDPNQAETVRVSVTIPHPITRHLSFIKAIVLTGGATTLISAPVDIR